MHPHALRQLWRSATVTPHLLRVEDIDLGCRQPDHSFDGQNITKLEQNYLPFLLVVLEPWALSVTTPQY